MNPLVLYTEGNSPVQLLLLLASGSKHKNSVGSLSMSQTAYLEHFDWRNALQTPVVKLATYGTQSCLVTLPSAEGKTALRLVADCPQGYVLNAWSAEQFVVEDEASFLKGKLGLYALESEGSYAAQTAQTWFLLFRHRISVPAPMNIFFRLDLLDPSIRMFCNLKIFDNDTNSSIPYTNRSMFLTPNKASLVASLIHHHHRHYHHLEWIYSNGRVPLSYQCQCVQI
jgi:hypothetical protein